MERTADLSVIIPAYRAADTIGRALASIAAQTVKPREVIVIDDGSDDGTLDAATAMGRSMDGIAVQVLSQQNAGAGAARNKGIAAASGTYLAFLDADDEWLPEKIAHSMATIEDGLHVLVSHNYLRIEVDGQEHMVDCARRFNAAPDPYVGLYRQGFIATSTVLVRREAALAAGGFDETLATAQDFDLWLKILGQPGATFAVLPVELTRYYICDGSITTFTARRLACTLRIARRHVLALTGRAGSMLMHLWIRVCAVHYEAFNAHCASRRPMAALMTALSLPWHLARSTLDIPAINSSAPTWVKAFLWAWVIVGFGTYMYRFQHLGQAAFKMLAQL